MENAILAILRTSRRIAYAALLGALCAAPASADDPAAAVMTHEATRRVRLDRESHNVLRMGPGEDFAVVAVVPEGSNYEVIAKSGSWYNVRVSESQTAWVHSSLCHEYDDLSSLEFRPNPRLFSRIGTFTATAYGGGYSFDRKSNSLVLGGRLGYYIFDFVTVEGGLSWTHVTRPAEIVESLFDLTLEAEDFHMLFYEMNTNVEILPGRQLVPYATGGLGSSILRGETETSWNLGAGVLCFVKKKVAMRWEFRNYRFESGSENARRDNSNYTFTMGTTFLL
ncbi:MAG TPA: outer membrane beta-barrel protein [bacterium]|nr:outer membrane beta-barrel protein [bacterium]